MVKTRLNANADAHIILFHEKTLKPSRIPKGIKLKRAIQALKVAANSKIG